MDPGAAADPWACRQFLVKWARSSYLHCTWETKAALSSVGRGGREGEGGREEG
jgi:hypothetical protein